MLILSHYILPIYNNKLYKALTTAYVIHTAKNYNMATRVKCINVMALIICISIIGMGKKMFNHSLEELYKNINSQKLPLRIPQNLCVHSILNKNVFSSTPFYQMLQNLKNIVNVSYLLK